MDFCCLMCHCQCRHSMAVYLQLYCIRLCNSHCHSVYMYVNIFICFTEYIICIFSKNILLIGPSAWIKLCHKTYCTLKKINERVNFSSFLILRILCLRYIWCYSLLTLHPFIHCTFGHYILQCFDAVGWVAGRASGLLKLSGGVLAWLSV